ncbi:hypothetical protein M422DRAFT_33746 [Sphaerobolus stellatus SS14]|uniref:Uncharacterized protein n=1 Tax=Sphaerobolus stellatus (strain SS14) TaxID=990650 RepID=A0A0C9U3L0_SPHS4|nr:hypothetical protein M422DRAFT_33746 [Sphaerobolus stellatus SS14]
MCFIDRSLEQVTSTCAMCKVFPPRLGFPCPHKDSMGVCKNRTNHPRHDVLYFRNAELSFFNGCGFCKWVKRNPKLMIGDAIWRNPGWPGCCRPPKPQEYDCIAPTDWYAVSKIHAIPAPTPSPPSPNMPLNRSPTSSPPSRSKSINPASPRTPERGNSGSRDRAATYLASPPSSSSSSGSPVDARRDVFRKSDTAVTRTPIVPSGTLRSPRASPPERAKYPATKTGTLRAPPPPRPANPAPPSTNSSSSGSRSSFTQSGTVTSEGFTDYLSDESEAEVQREAERRAAEAELAALLEKQRLETGREEQEFRAARTQLATVGLQPPSAWSTGKPIPGSKPPTEATNNPASAYGTAGRSAYRSATSTQYLPVYAVRQ